MSNSNMTEAAKKAIEERQLTRVEYQDLNPGFIGGWVVVNGNFFEWLDFVDGCWVADDENGSPVKIPENAELYA